MSKRIEKDGKFYRMRRGKLVEIPNQWVGKVPYDRWYGLESTIAKRKSKTRKKVQRRRCNRHKINTKVSKI